MNLNRKILIIVPYKARDLQGLSLLGYLLKKEHNYEIVYQNGYGIEEALLKHAPAAVVFDHLAWDFKVKQVRLAKQLDMKVVVLPTEGLLQDRETARKLIGKNHNGAKYIDLFLPWGRYTKEAVLEETLMPEDRITVTGCPRFDFYSPEYSGFIRSRSKFIGELGIQNIDGPIILWATNIPYVGMKKKKVIDRYSKKAKWNTEDILKYYDDQEEQFRNHSQLIMDLAERHREWNIVIKVHPAETINSYVDIAESHENVYLAYNAPILEFLHHADVLLQRNCTTATEAWMLRKPSLQLEIGSYHVMARKEYIAGNEVVNTQEDAEKVISNYVSGGTIPPDQQSARDMFIDEFYHKIDGGATVRCAAAIHNLLSPPSFSDEEYEQTKMKVKVYSDDWERNESRKLQNRLKDFLGIDRDTTLRFWKKLNGLRKKPNLGLFVSESQIDDQMIEEQYKSFEQHLANIPGQ